MAKPKVKISTLNGQPVILAGETLVDLDAEQAEKIGWDLIHAAQNYRVLKDKAAMERRPA